MLLLRSIGSRADPLTIAYEVNSADGMEQVFQALLRLRPELLEKLPFTCQGPEKIEKSVICGHQKVMH